MRWLRDLPIAAGLLVALALATGACAPGDRCVDVGRARACYRRGALVRRSARNADPGRASWERDGARSVEAYPQLPDDGEWECSDLAGAAVCHGGGTPAGVFAGPVSDAWSCGARAKHVGERVCVDLSPDLPATGDWHCHYEHAPTETRVCEPGTHGASIGRTCASSSSCPLGARCERGACLPARLSPGCYLPADCEVGQACRFGTCIDEPHR